ncbi:MAG: NADH-quinone oxidoreductase subunit L, partial [Planctomycetes bacterium]|nr:NADH-quinone oxidoreductase subunit L [Planctomycetota bacterium]
MATVLQICLILGVLLPLASFAVLVFFGQRFPAGAGLLHRAASGLRPRARHFESPEYEPPQYGPGEPLAGWIATAACALSCVLALVVLVIWAGDPETRGAWTRAAVDSAPIWLRLGSMPIEVGVRLDSLTVIVFFMVTFCATCIHVFSLGYMRGETGYTRFFAFLSLFCFSMLGLVIAANLMLTFVFWELVGVCSYFLIGHWFEKKSASNAAIKAFVVNRVGDFGFLFGLGLCIAFLGTLSLDQLPAVFEAGAHKAGWATGALSPAAEKVAEAVATRASQLFTTQLGGISLATLLGLGLFCGAIGKSAQFPLHVWLPDAMEGPTPVSALIHAATMVAAGVYMVARIYAVLTPGALFVISVIGCITLTMAALMAVVQTDIKRVLAYSTLSQLGYMVFGLGVGSWIGALFHLLTHAFFKALLFLGSGQVIAACHHEQDMRKMGGLAPKLKRTAGCFLIAVLAISGAGIPWTSIGLGGFYSKDEILVVAMARLHAYTGAGEAAGGWHVPTWLFALPVLIAWLTPLYMG